VTVAGLAATGLLAPFCATFPGKSMPGQVKRSMGRTAPAYLDSRRAGIPGASPADYAGFQHESSSFRPFCWENDLHIHREAID
jgi:hypothetical protein